MSEEIDKVRYGFVDENNILRDVFVIKENDFVTLDRLRMQFNYSNAYPINFEKEVAEIGIVYWNGNRFVYPSPYPSWVFDENINDWTAPVPKPDSSHWVWNEETLSWVEQEMNNKDIPTE
jgi:hypothetical protein